MIENSKYPLLLDIKKKLRKQDISKIINKFIDLEEEKKNNNFRKQFQITLNQKLKIKRTKNVSK